MRRHWRSIPLLLGLLGVWGAAGAWPARAQPSNGLSDRWGVNDDSGIRPALPWGSGAFARASAAGFGWVRYWLYWNTTNPAPERFDWSSADVEIDDALGRGLQVYANIMWAPDWAVQGTPGYQPWHCMDAKHPPTFVPNPGCDGRRPDTAAFQKYVRAAVRRYGDRVRFWGFWNEPNYAIFWHSAEPGKLEQNIQDFVDFLLIPGAEAARQENPDVLITGPETDNPHALEIILERDDQYFRRTGRRLLDVISIHQYPSKADLRSGHLTEFGPLLDRFNAAGKLLVDRAGRPVWLTESKATAATMQELLTEIAARGWIDRFFYYGFKALKCRDSGDPICQSLWLEGRPDESDLIDFGDKPLPGYEVIRRTLTDTFPGGSSGDGSRGPR